MKTNPFQNLFLDIKNLYLDILETLLAFYYVEGNCRRREERWRKEAIQRGATHVIECWDSSEMEITPLYVMQGEDVSEICKRVNDCRTLLLGGRLLIINPPEVRRVTWSGDIE